MKIIQTKKDSVLVECSYDEMSNFFTIKGKTLYRQEVERLCNSGEELEVIKKVKNFGSTLSNDVDMMIASIESTLTFLKNKSASLKDSK